MSATLHIGFVANFWLTPTMLAVARTLEHTTNSEVHWFSPSTKWAKWLRREGVPESRIVLLRSANPSDAILSTLTVPDYAPTVDHLLRSDRVLNLLPPAQARVALARVVQAFSSAIRTRHLDVVFGEATWSFEVAMSYAARAQGVPYVMPVPTRIPSGRLGFSLAPLQDRLIDLPPADSDMPPQPVDVLRAFRERDDTPLWAHNAFTVGRYLRQPALWAEKLLDVLTDSRGNPSQLDLSGYLRSKNPVSLARNARALSTRMEKESKKNPQQVESPYVLMPLQVQPEASVDVVAWRGSDQLANVRAVSASVPEGMLVAVKEHSHRFGSRGVAFFDELRKLPNVVLVDPHADSRAWMSGAAAVVAPSGTMCLENALSGRKSVVMAPMFFDALPSVAVMDPKAMDGLAAFLGESVAPDEGALLHYLSDTISRSRPGSFTAQRDVPESLSRQNIANLARAFYAASTSVTRADA